MHISNNILFLYKTLQDYKQQYGHESMELIEC